MEEKRGSREQEGGAWGSLSSLDAFVPKAAPCIVLLLLLAAWGLDHGGPRWQEKKLQLQEKGPELEFQPDRNQCP